MREKGTASGTTTDAKGEFVINAPEDGVLVFSFIGYSTQEISVGSRSTIEVRLLADTHLLSEVVVMGYGSVEKKDLIGSVGVASSKDFGNVNVSNAQQLIQGKVAGVQVINSSGLPGSDVKITVRGTGTFTNADPLYVIDGIQGNSNQFNAISPYDIESITVLKDVSSTAIYGANAANGVVIVTTRKAKAGTTRITYNGYYGVAHPWKQLDMMNSQQYLDLVKDITNNNLTTKLQSPYVLVDRTNWQDAIFRTARLTEHNIGISGGTEKVLYNFSTTYPNQDGVMGDYNFKRLQRRYDLDKCNANSNLILPNGIDEYYGWGVNPLLENYFSFNKHIGIHQINATLGNTYRKGAIGRSVSLSGSDFPNDDLKSVIAAPTSRITGGFVGQSALLSYFARVNYTLMDKYLLTASIRRDGSYVFSKDSRFGNFPSVGLGWKINEEGFMKGLPVLSQLKLRASYGLSGNSNIPQLVPSVWKGQANNIVYSLGAAKGYAQGATVNSAVSPNNRWETTKQFDIGLDAGFLEDRLLFSLGYYNRRNEGLLTYVPLPLSTGIGGPYDNPGSILKNTATASNKEIEGILGYQGSVGNFRYSLSANAARNTNKVISLGEGTAFQRGSVAGGNLATKTDMGHPIGSFYGYVVD